MHKLIWISALVVTAFAVPNCKVDDCDSNTCVLPDCLCPSLNPPGSLNPAEIPQLVLLAFEDSIASFNTEYYDKAFNGRTNPDGCTVGTTYLLSHPYTDYSLVHDLWAQGHEIALHSIGGNNQGEMTVEDFVAEYADQVDLINKFAKIPKEDMTGVAFMPFHYPRSNGLEMMVQAGLKYDCFALELYPKSKFWPHTIDHEGFPGIWVIPPTEWRDEEGTLCSMIDACKVIPKDETGLLNFMIENFNGHYINGTKQPFAVNLHSAWFAMDPVHFSAYLRFLDYLQTLPDVYMVSIQRALEWMQNPSTLDDLQNSWPSCQTVHPNACKKNTCQLPYGDNQVRWITHCDDECPTVYPCVNNPLGLAPEHV